MMMNKSYYLFVKSVKSVPNHKAALIFILSPQSGTSLHCKTTDTGLMRRK